MDGTEDYEREADALEQRLIARRERLAIASAVFGALILLGDVASVVATWNSRAPFVMVGLGVVLGVGFLLWGVVAHREGEAAATDLIERLRSL